ncbi:sulfur carrier protein ThiS [Microbulbifer marinus]|uniref:Sulfur carrier protein n=1 Tax=Microbulbifer marinus TaxID=658218 RepID=A0A1H3VLG2_9GAMM|nr:sulfur carrier protein ThiS [Microbulbifer marinus]SDZ74968.1 sulfur carrier protein [Microbulbifer marinus]
MQIFVNGQAQSVECPNDLKSLLQQLGYRGETFAVALNGDFVPRENYLHIELKDGDALDVVAPVVGG